MRLLRYLLGRVKKGLQLSALLAVVFVFATAAGRMNPSVRGAALAIQAVALECAGSDKDADVRSGSLKCSFPSLSRFDQPILNGIRLTKSARGVSEALRLADRYVFSSAAAWIGRDRFRQTLTHARAHLERRRAGDLGRRLLALVNDIKPEAPKLDRLIVKSGGRVFFLRTGDLDWIEAAGNYVRLHLGEESHLFRETMNRMESRLDPKRFVRIHRSRIVNTERIKELQPWFNGEYVVVLRNGARLPLSRGYRDKLQEQLGKGF